MQVVQQLQCISPSLGSSNSNWSLLSEGEKQAAPRGRLTASLPATSRWLHFAREVNTTCSVTRWNQAGRRVGSLSRRSLDPACVYLWHGLYSQVSCCWSTLLSRYRCVSVCVSVSERDRERWKEKKKNSSDDKVCLLFKKIKMYGHWFERLVKGIPITAAFYRHSLQPPSGLFVVNRVESKRAAEVYLPGKGWEYNSPPSKGL